MCWANYILMPIKSPAVALVLEDNMFLSDVKDVPIMAVKAGYTDVRAYVYWKRTGRWRKSCSDQC